MSSLIGDVGERWSLARAVDALGDAARQAGALGWIWLAGLVYPALSLSPGFSFEQSFHGDGIDWRLEGFDPWLGTPVVLLPLLLPFFALVSRLSVGLARIATPAVWQEHSDGRRPPSLKDVWRAGRGVTLSAFGLWAQLLLLWLVTAVVLFVLPLWILISLTEVSDLFYFGFLLLGPVIALLLFYMALLGVLYQLALHSLAQNRRGVTSALTHAWRIARHDPWATVRAALVEVLLYLTILLLSYAVGAALLITCVGAILIVPAVMALNAYAGVVRACYWARAYRALGGLSPDDQIPGLERDLPGPGSAGPEPA